MVTQYGMSKKFGLIALESIEHRYLDGRPVMNCGQDTVSEIDHEVMELLEECHAKAVKLLEENRDVLDKIAAYLTEKETITGKQFMELYEQAVAERTGASTSTAEATGAGASEQKAETAEDPVKTATVPEPEDK